MSSRQSKQIIEGERLTRAMRAERRDAVCVAPEYPGKPEDYTYVLAEYCRLKTAEAKQKKAKAAAAKKGGPISAAQTKRELKIVTDALNNDDESEDAGDLPLNRINAIMMTVLGGMMDTRSRSKYPNPLERFNMIKDEYHKRNKDAMISAIRFMVLRLYKMFLEHS